MEPVQPEPYVRRAGARRAGRASAALDAFRSWMRPRVHRCSVAFDGRSARWVALAIGAFILLVLVAVFSAGPAVRRRIADMAARRHVTVEMGDVRVGWFSVALRNVEVVPQDEPWLKAHLDEITVDVGISAKPRSVLVRGGHISLWGDVDAIQRHVRELKGGDTSSSTSSDAGSMTLSGESLHVDWQRPEEPPIVATDLSVTRKDGRYDVRCGRCALENEGLRVEVAELTSSLLHDGAPERLAARSLKVVVRPHVKRSAGESIEGEPRHDERLVPRDALKRLRRRLDKAVLLVAPRLPVGASCDVEELSFEFEDDDPLALAPGALRLTRDENDLKVSFRTEQEQKDAPSSHGTTPLSVVAILPLHGGEMNLELSGGPVSLARLGVTEGMRGLTNVSQASVAGRGKVGLGDAGEAMTFDVVLDVTDVSIESARLSPEPLRGLSARVAAKGAFESAGRLRVDDAEVTMGAMHLRAHGTIDESDEALVVALGAYFAPAPCQALVESAPTGLLPLVRAGKMTGTFAASATMAFDTRVLDKLVLDYRIDDQCRLTEVPDVLSRERFARAFIHRTYKPDGSLGELETGPGTPEWAPLDDISPFMTVAILTTEDGAFFRHKGFNHAAIRSSVQANLKARRFVRGASTISMQLAKNLFLAREKTLSRKIEEIILTDYLEQTFSKEEIVELYLNVVEFGPDVYGIRHAAEYYFGRRPDDLNVAECFFLATLLPSPLRYGKMREKGEVSEGWMKHVRTLIETAGRRGTLSPTEVQHALGESIVFWRGDVPKPEPRKPARSGYDDDDMSFRPRD